MNDHKQSDIVSWYIIVLALPLHDIDSNSIHYHLTTYWRLLLEAHYIVKLFATLDLNSLYHPFWGDLLHSGK